MRGLVGTLLAKINRFHLDKKEDWSNVRFEAEQGLISEDMAELLLFQMEDDIQRQLDYPDYLHRLPEDPDELTGDREPHVHLGTLLDDHNISFGVRFDSPLHIILAGLTGFGKTTAARVLMKGIHEFNRASPDQTISVIAFDRKINDYGDFPGLCGWLIFDVHKSLRLSLEAPQGVPPGIWINIIATLFCARAGLKAAWSTIVVTLRWILAQLNPRPGDRLVWPTFELLLNVLTASPRTLWSSKGEYAASSIQPLEGLVLSSGSTFQAMQGFQAGDIIAHKQSAVISMPNMFPSWARQLFTDIVIAQVLYSRIHHSHRVDSTEALFMLDEADSDVSQEAENMFPDRMCPVSQCFAQGRELGISMCVSIKDLHSASRFVLNNATHHYIFRMNNAESLSQAGRTLMLPPGGEMRISYLQPGECVLRQIGPWPHAMAGKIEYMPPCRTRPARYDSHPFLAPKRLRDLPDLQQALYKLIDSHGNDKQRKSVNKKARSGLSDLARKMLELAYDHPFMPVVHIFRKIANVRFSKQRELRLEIEKLQLAAFEELRVGRANMLLMELLPGAYELLGRPPLETRGRGSISHRFMANWIAMAHARRGFPNYIEWVIPDTKHPGDVAVDIGGRYDIFEISVTCSDNLADSIQSCFQNPDIINTVTVITAQKGISKKLQASVLSELLLFDHIDQLRFDVIEPYLKELWP